MLDTIILTIPRGFYRIPKPYMFTPNAEIIRGPGNYLVKCVNNPTANDKRNGIYRPRLTLMKRMTKNGKRKRIVENPERRDIQSRRVFSSLLV